MFTRCTLFFVICCCSNLLSAQQLAYRHFGINEGLPHSELYAICQAPDKTLWISTDNGLSHYDGTSFFNYNPKLVTTSNYILYSVFLPDGRLLVNAYRKGLCFLEKGVLVKAEVDTNGFKHAATGIKALYTLTYDAINQCVWAISASRALMKLTIKGNVITVAEDRRPGIYFWVYVDIAAKTTYIGSTEGLGQYLNGNIVPIASGPQGRSITKIMELDRQTFLLATSNSILFFNKEKKTVDKEVRFADSSLHYELFMYDPSTQFFWLPVKTGGVKIFTLSETQKAVFSILPEVNFNHLFADGLGNVWCCSYGNGLFQFPQGSIVNYNAQEGLKDNYVTHISRSDKMYVSCLKSYYQFDTLAGRFKVLLETDARKPYNKSVLLPNGTTGFLNADAIIAQHGEKYYHNNAVIYDAAKLDKDSFLLGCFGGLKVLNNQYKEFDAHFPMGNQRVNKLLVSGDSILVATASGFYVRSFGKWYYYNEKNGLPNDIVEDIGVVNGKIYVAGRSGMTIIDREGKVSAYDKMKAGSISIVGLAVDNWGGMWMATGNGLYLDYKDRLYQFDQFEGLISNDVTEVFANGRKLYAGTTQGLSVIDLGLLYQNLDKPSATFLQVAVAVWDGTTERPILNHAELSPNENDIQVNLIGPDFYYPQQRVLEYSLDGGLSWAPILNRQLNLRSLNYGSYHLQVRTKLRNEQGYKLLADYQFRIAVPWFSNVFFIVSVVFVLILLAGLLFLRYSKKRHQQAVQQLQVKQQVLDLKQKAMAAMLNPHFVFNSINSINYYIHNGEEEKYTRLLTDLSRLIRLNLNNTYQDKVTLASELEIIELYVEFEKHRFIRHPLDFSINYESALSAQYIKVPSMMLQPFVENAIWHGILPKQGGYVSLTVSDAPDGYIEVAIKDDGNGCDPAKLTATRADGVRGVGLIQERIQAYNSLHKKPVELLFPHADIGCTVLLRFPA